MKPYTKGDLIATLAQYPLYAREILNPQGRVICHIIEHRDDETTFKGRTTADELLKLLNQEQA